MADDENENPEAEAAEEGAEDEAGDAEEGGEEDAAEGEEGEDGEEGEGGKKKKKKKGKFTPKQKIIIIAVGMLLLLGIPVGLYFGGVIGGSTPPAEGEAPAEGEVPEVAAEVPAEAVDPVFYEMEEFLVNLNTGGKQVKFLKMNVMLELPDAAAVEYLEPRLPRIRDSFQIYLRELRAEDLQGSKGIQRLREELLLRVNKELYPVKVNNILFKDILVQ
jgi:flagellar FliL protein